MAKNQCEFCENSKAEWRCVNCGMFLCNSCIDKKFSVGRFLAKGAITAITGGLGAGSFAVGKGASKDHKCLRCSSKNIKRIY